VAVPALFDVQVRLESADAPADATALVTKALGDAIPLEGVTGRASVSTSENGVTVRFEGVAAPGDTESQFRLQEVLPAVQALITAIIDRVAAGTPTQPRLVIEVQPAEGHGQRELRRS
jgi:hypothetical protein